jgi:hypothetical protein
MNELKDHFGAPVTITIARDVDVAPWQVMLLKLPLLRTPKTLFDPSALREICLGSKSNVRGFSSLTEGSSYEAAAGRVRLFPELFSMRAKTLVSIGTHEFGHALFEGYLLRDYAQNGNVSTYAELKFCWFRLRQNGGIGLGGIVLEGFADASERRDYQAGQFCEFLAETFMLYRCTPKSSGATSSARPATRETPGRGSGRSWRSC